VVIALTTIGAIVLVDENVGGLAALALARSLDPDAASAALAAIDGLMGSPLRLAALGCFWLSQAILFVGIALDRDLRYPVGIPLAVALVLMLFYPWTLAQRLAPLALAASAAILARRGTWEAPARPLR
jgi:hypothetical protein